MDIHPASPVRVLITALATAAMPLTATAAVPVSTVAPDATISVRAENGKAQRFDDAALARLPQQTVHAEAHGKTIACTGPALIDVLATAGAPSGDKLRGKNLALYVRVSAADGYHAVFALAELDRGFRDAVPIVTDHCDGAPLDAHDGPFRIIVPGEKRPARWVRQVTAIDLLRAP